ncbi:hypothetical protein M513_09641 [Trichuris suis]|uniref:Innexin n=1 Tax=Trichuris suis TaxID=68888 RepID=A0A085LWW0_9BILA|nr:hypothetical protein M513_09641 [Trichuris suis]
MSRPGKLSAYALQDNAEDPIELESHFILRLPPDVAKSLNSVLTEGMLLDELQINLDSDMRTGKVKFNDREMHASLVDLPCIVETLKTMDKKSFYKVTDVAQLLVCREGAAEPPVDLEESSDPKKREKQHQWPHGITPPLKNVRKRRFRKTLRKKYMDAPELEKELKRLLRADIEAASIKWEIVSIQEEAKQKANTTNEALDTSLEAKTDLPLYTDEPELDAINEDDLFGEAVSSSSSELEDECLIREVDIVPSLDSEDSNSIDISNAILKSLIASVYTVTDLLECEKRKEHIENQLFTIQNLSLKERLSEEVRGLVEKMSQLEREVNDDFVDRANYFYTPSALLIFALIVSTRQWIGQPIECWVPAEFKYAWEEYTENYCYIQDTYWLPMSQTIPLGTVNTFEKRISYYQWVPFILGTQAIIFCSPFALWRLCNFRSGFNIDAVVSVARESAMKLCREGQPTDIALLASFVKDVLNMKLAAEQYARKNCNWSRLVDSGYFLTLVYSLVKLLYVVVAALQLLFLETVLSTGGKFGSSVFPQLLSGVEWQESGAFPRVTLCEFAVRILGNVNRYTVQCVLMINMFNEKIFLLTWCWVAALLTLNVIHVIRWLLTLSVPHWHIGPTARLLSVHFTCYGPPDKAIVVEFVKRLLRSDGVLLIEKVAYHAGDVVASRLAFELFSEYVAEKEKRWSLLAGGDKEIAESFNNNANGGTKGEAPKRYVTVV